MHNPFQLFTTALLESLIQNGNRYFVRQAYKRGIDHFDETQKGAFLFSHYNDIHKATMHYGALPLDGGRYLYDISNTAHLEKLKVAAQQPAGYKIYSPLLLTKWKPSKILAGKIRLYVNTRLNWNLSGKDSLQIQLITQFGELFIALRSGEHVIEIPLADVERL